MEKVENVGELKNKIPHQLQKDGFGFVKLKACSKIPLEQDWQNKSYSATEIQPWIEQGGNYGVQGGYGGLVIIDADTPEIAEILVNKFPETLTVKTPRKGFHYYFFCAIAALINSLNRGCGARGRA